MAYTLEQIELRKILSQMLADEGINRETLKDMVNEVFVGASDFARDTRAAAQSLIDSQPEISRWIPVKEQMPEVSEMVLITDPRNRIDVGFYNDLDEKWFALECGSGAEVIAWMPLPEPYDPQN